MTDSQYRNPRAFQDAMDRRIEEKPESERMKEPGKNGPGLDDLIDDVPLEPQR
jgi:hypothetical protein